MRLSEQCIVCLGTQLLPDNDYMRCAGCGHETLSTHSQQTYMINEVLDSAVVGRATALDRFKNSILRRWMRGDSVLVDFGSASGRFLYQNRNLFRSAIGLEVTDEAVAFSKQVLRLDIRTTVEDLSEGIDVVTCWHSLEHVPSDGLHTVVAGLAKRLSDSGRMIVSVPNAASLQYRLFGRHYAFYDVPNHHQQFSLRSLDALMKGVGLKRERLAHSTVYNMFGWLQGALNVLVGGHNDLYYRLKRGVEDNRKWRLMGNLLLVPVLAVPTLLIMVAEVALSERQGVITACYTHRAP